MNAIRPGRRLFIAASVLLMLIAILHTAGHWPLLFPDAPFSGALQTMAGERQALGLGMTPTVLDIHRSLVLTMTVMLMALAALNLLVANAAGDVLLRRVLCLNVVYVGALAALYAVYQIPPPLLTFGLAEIVLVAALFTAPVSQTTR